MQFVGKILDMADTKVGQLLLENMTDQALFTMVGTFISKFGIPETRVCDFLNMLTQIQPKGGYVALLRDKEFRDSLREFLAVWESKDSPTEGVHKIEINSIDPAKL